MSITVFGQPGCAPCGATKRALDTLGLDYDYVDITSTKLTVDQTRIVYQYRGTPIVVAGEDSWSGHNVEKLKALAA